MFSLLSEFSHFHYFCYNFIISTFSSYFPFLLYPYPPTAAFLPFSSSFQSTSSSSPTLLFVPTKYPSNIRFASSSGHQHSPSTCTSSLPIWSCAIWPRCVSSHFATSLYGVVWPIAAFRVNIWVITVTATKSTEAAWKWRKWFLSWL